MSVINDRITNIEDYINVKQKEIVTRLPEVVVNEEEERIKEKLEEMKKQYIMDNNYQGDHTIYKETVEEFNARVIIALDHLKKNFEIIHLEALKYLYYVLSLTNNNNPKNPLFLDIEAFEDILEPFIMLFLLNEVGEGKAQLKDLFETASKVVEDILISDFIFSPFKNKDEDKRFVTLTPELYFAMEHILKVQDQFKYFHNVLLKEGGKVDHVSMFVSEESQIPTFQLKLKYNDDFDLGAMGDVMTIVDLDVSQLAEIYYHKEYLEDEEYSLEEIILIQLTTNIQNEITKRLGKHTITKPGN